VSARRDAVAAWGARLRHLASESRKLQQRVLAGAGVRHSEARIARDSQAYWTAPPTRRSKADSHWRGAETLDDDLWLDIGRGHLEIYRRACRALGRDERAGRVLEWGCGGGANAVHFAPLADEFVGVEVSAASLDECATQVRAVCSTPFRPVLVDVGHPEAAVAAVGGPVDVYTCFYVFELIPTPEYGARLLDIARDVLRPGGVGIVQIKYSTGSWWTAPRRRGYRSGLAEMTTYPIDGFWQLVRSAGLDPVHVELVPRNELDERYAYFVLRKPG
jgi:SAM-dependent methyltransferase